MYFRLTIAILFLSATAAYAQHANHKPPTTKQLNTLASRNANQALDRTAAPSALSLQPIVPGADATPALGNAGLYDNPALTNPPSASSRPYDPGSIHYPYGRTSLGNVDPASRANPYGPYSTPPDNAYGHYSGPTLPQTPNTLFGNPAPAFAIPSPSFAPNNTPAFSRGR